MVPVISRMGLDKKLSNLSVVVWPVRKSDTISVKHLGTQLRFTIGSRCRSSQCLRRFIL